MAVLKNLVVAASMLASLTLAVPMAERPHIFTHTETEYVMVTIEETTTVWVNPSEETQAPAPVSQSVAEVTASETVAAVTTTTTPTPTPTPTAAAFHQELSVSTTTLATSTTFTSVVVPVTTSAPVATSALAPVASSSTASAPAASTSAVNVQAKDITASASATCEGTSAACVGDVTHWDGGLGACGWNVDTNSDMAIALPYAFMGTQSNGNPYCGRKVTLVNPTSGTTVTATVGDKCMGCVDRAIDCTDALFNAITDGKGDGRLSGIEWYFSS